MATNLQFINSFEITSSVSTLNCDNVFTDKYDVYQIVAYDLETAGSTAYANLRLIDSSGNVEALGYDFAYLSMKPEASFGEVRVVSGTFWQEFFGNPDLAPQGSGTVGYIFNPFGSSFTFCKWQSFHSQGSVNRIYKAIGVHKFAESMRGFQLQESLGNNITAGKISVYGVK